MSLILGGSGARISRRSALRLGLAGFGLPGLLSGNIPAYGQPAAPLKKTRGNYVCPVALVGADPDAETPVYYYYGMDCPDPTQLFGIESPVLLPYGDTGDCPSGTPSSTWCSVYGCSGCERLPPIPGKILPIPGKMLPIPGKSAPSMATPPDRECKEPVHEPSARHCFERDHFMNGVRPKRGTFDLPAHQIGPRVDKIEGPVNKKVRIAGVDRYVGLLLFKPKHPIRGMSTPVGIGREVLDPHPVPTDEIPVQFHGGKAAYYRRDDGQYFHILMKR